MPERRAVLGEFYDFFAIFDFYMCNFTTFVLSNLSCSIKKLSKMSTAELTARHIYNTMHLADINEDVKKHLIILMLSEPEKTCVPSSYEESLALGAMDLEDARKELHSYANELSDKYGMK